jgi:drug/metabolite transporter (DMT)-like permease
VGNPSPKPLLRGGSFAVLAALSFGITAPLVQRLGRGVGPIPSATLLYAGAALVSIDVVRHGQHRDAPVRATHLPRLVLVAALGAVLAPICLTWGLQHTTATGASLVLNFEAVFTAVLAWLFFREPIGRRVALALALMVIGGTCLVFGGASGSSAIGWGAAAVVLATLCWAFDNTLTRPLADLNPTQVVRWKGTLGAVTGLLFSLVLHEPFPRPSATLALLGCGAAGFGISLRFYLLAQRRIGAARTGSIFALAPFFGVAAAWAMGDRSGNSLTVLAGALFGLGVYLHLTEGHAHRHTHQPMEHEHLHGHDDGHHEHRHDPAVIGEHSHPHSHEGRTHEHAHAPDLHHRHAHKSGSS